MSTQESQKTVHTALYNAWRILTECEDGFEFAERSAARSILTCAQRHLAHSIMRLRAMQEN